MLRSAALLLLAAAASAEVELAPIFGNNMVLQRDAKVAVWGTARANQKVLVSFLRQTTSVRADKDGRWRAELGPFAVHEGDKLLVAGGGSRVTLENVAVGEVWICSGQSNMFWPVGKARRAAEELKDCADAGLRLFTVPRRGAETPQTGFAKPTAWVAAAPDTVRSFSAVAYFFGRELRRSLGVPVGLIHSSVGGTPSEAWTRPAALEGQPVLARWEQVLADYPEALRRFEGEMQRWRELAKQARRQRQRPPPRPRKPPGPDHPHRPGNLWHGMIAPLVPFTARGVIWYQGEANAGRADEYRTIFPLMIDDWRKAWGTEFWFLFVQLANFRDVATRVTRSTWAELRDAQRHALSRPRTGMAVTIDIGEARDIHPKNKQEVGRRLALIARGKAYGEGTVHSGPVLREFSVDGPHFVLEFDHVDGGLGTRDGDPPQGFLIAGEDRRFRFAYARLEGNRVIVWHPSIRKPAAVRYAWADNPFCNLVNGAGLPAGPFRTDTWTKKATAESKRAR